MGRFVLFVDDEFPALAAIKRQLHSRAEVELAAGAEDALRRLAVPDRYAVVVTDLRMPGIGGLQLLAQARAIAPDVVRVILTGNFDARSALTAVNDAQVFRVLVKPCDPATLLRTLHDAVALHRRLSSDRILLDRTKSGAVALLADLLDLVRPTAAERAMRLKGYARHVAETLQFEDPGLYETAALLTQVGFLTLPGAIMQKMASGRTLGLGEQALVDGCWETGSRLAHHLPSLLTAAEIVSAHVAPQHHLVNIDDSISVGAHLLRVVVAYDTLATAGVPTDEIIRRLELDPITYPAHMVDAMRAFRPKVQGTDWVLECKDLKPGMVFQEDVRARDGALLASRSQQATATVVDRIRTFAQGVGVVEPIRVMVPQEHA